MKQVLKSHVVEHARDTMLRAGLWEVSADFQPYVTFASGEQANNKLDIEAAIAEGRSLGLQAAVTGPLTTLIVQHNPDALWGVPSGGQAYAVIIGGILGLPVIKLKKKDNLPGVKTYELEDPEKGEAAINKAKVVVALEDAISELTSLYGALRLSPELADLAAKTVAAAGVWWRGLPSKARDIGIEVDAVVKEHIPNLITPDHPFYKKYGSLAVKREAA